MSFQIQRNNITKVSADAIVNTANPLPVAGRGTDNMIYEAAGYNELLAARRKIGEIKAGESAWTPAFNLNGHGVKFIIHTVGTFYDSKDGSSEEILHNCYKTAFNIAAKLGCKSVAVPLMATGFYGFPKELGLRIAIDEISEFLFKNKIEIILVVYDDKSYKISEKVFDDIQDYLSHNCEENHTVEAADRFAADEIKICESFNEECTSIDGIDRIFDSQNPFIFQEVRDCKS